MRVKKAFKYNLDCNKGNTHAFFIAWCLQFYHAYGVYVASDQHLLFESTRTSYSLYILTIAEV